MNSYFLQVSRPRFWLYLLGPYLIGITAAGIFQSGLTVEVVVWFLFFTFPANFFVYAVNDFFDREIDEHSSKKKTYEVKATSNRNGQLLLALTLLGLLFPPFLFLLSSEARITLILFLFLSFLYSAPPLRFKTVPILDSISNVLYVVPGIFGYLLVSSSFPPIHLVVATWLFCIAMHAYSAVPDIQTDTKGGIATIATFLGKKMTLVLCAVLYTLAFVIGSYTYTYAILLSVPYIYLVAKMYRATTTHDELSVYRRFPLLNAFMGFFVWLAVFVKMYLQ